MSSGRGSLSDEIARIRAGGRPEAHEKARAQGKLFVRDRLERLLDPDSFVEDGLFANARAGDLPADGIVTGSGRIRGRDLSEFEL